MNLDGIPGSDMTSGLPNFDRTTTYLAGTAFLLSSLVLFGNAEFSAFGYSLSSGILAEVFSLAGITITWGSLISLAAIVAAYIGNNANLTEFSDHQSGLAIFTALTVVVTALSPSLSEAIAGNTTYGMIFVAIQILGYLAMTELKQFDSVGIMEGGVKP